MVGGATVLDGVDLHVATGEVVALTGENGAGKSTLIRCVAGLRRPTAGTVTVLGAEPDDGPAFWRDVALVADEPAWYPGLTAREHLELVRRTHGTAAGPVEDVLTFVGLTGRADAPPTELSTGQRQRLAIGAALVRPSRVLLLDEPEHGLDAAFRRTLADHLRRYAAEGGAVLLATHDTGLIGRAGARAVVLDNGRTVPA